ncbi:MAG: hypothetical protein QOG53_1783 [Frankiales bacterium]|jgi:hypothetical protein|nr:hypothetical protein [Frankiales bacterium]
MSTRKLLAAVVGVSTIGLSALCASPALAVCSTNCASTNVTFTLGGSGLALSVPSNTDVDLGSATSNVLGTTVSGALHSTTVTDTRGQLAAAWTVTVASTGFTGSGTAAGQSLAAGQAGMYLDAVTTLANAVALATGGLIPTSITTLATPVTLSSAGGTLMAGTTTGSGSITYTPGIKVTIPASAIAGTYSGAVTQTVS